MAQNYEKPKVRVEQTFESPSPELVPTDLIPNVVGPRFQVLNQEVIAEDENGYDGDLMSIAVPIGAETIVDRESIEVYLRHGQWGTFLVSEDKWSYDADNNLLDLDPDIEVQVDGQTRSFSNQEQADVEIDLKAMYARRPESNIDESQDMITIATDEELEARVGKIVPENPLAWGMFFTLTATDTIITGMPVKPETEDTVMQRLDDTGDPAPKDQGGTYYHYLDTVEFQTALTQLETEEVWSITANFPSEKYFNPELRETLVDIFLQHAEEQSKPENQRERIVTMVNPNYDNSLNTKWDMAEELKEFANAYDTRRLTLVVPPKVEVPVQGRLEVVHGDVLTNIVAGMDSFFPPQQPFTNLPMPGPINRVIGTNRFFNEEQLDEIAAGGNYIINQDTEGAAPYSRHQQTTHTQFIEKNERSIIRVVDFSAKFMRSELKPYVGKFNVTDNLLASMRTTVQGVISELEDDGVIRSGRILELRQNPDEPDGTIVKWREEVLYPNNDIDVEIIV